MVEMSVLAGLIAASTLRSVFTTIMKERRILYKDLVQEVPEAEKAKVQESLNQLKALNLIKEHPSDLEDFKSYSATADGLLAERDLKKVEASSAGSR